MADDSLETQLRRLAALVAPLAETVNQHDARLVQHEAHMARLDALNQRLVEAIERIDRTQARVETLLARMIRHEDNGRDA